MAEGGEDEIDKVEPVVTGQPVQAEEANADVENKPQPEPLPALEETEDQKLRRIFDQYDTAGADGGGPDGKLSFDEFKVAVTAMATTKKLSANQTAQLKRHTEEIFKRLDVNPKDGQLDFAEFKAGYKEVVEFTSNPDKWAERVAESLMAVVKANDPSGIVAGTEKAGKSAAATFGGAQVPPEEEQPLKGPADDGSSPPSACGGCIVFLIIGTLVLLVIAIAIVSLASFYYLIVGVSAGQSCDTPLKEFLIIVLVLQLLSICCSGAGARENTQGALQATSQNQNQQGPLAGCFVFLMFTWTIVGAVWFSEAGGFGDAPTGNNCQTHAPDLYDAVAGYFTMQIALLCSVVALMSVLFCAFLMGALAAILG